MASKYFISVIGILNTGFLLHHAVAENTRFMDEEINLINRCANAISHSDKNANNSWVEKELQKQTEWNNKHFFYKVLFAPPIPNLPNGHYLCMYYKR